MMDFHNILKHYSRKDVQEEMVRVAKDREIAVRFNDSFGKRPDIIQYGEDIIEFVKRGATSFHSSEERWKDPLSLTPTMKKKELNELRSGWDLIFDIDSKFLEFSKITSDLIIKALLYHGVESFSIKFSGNKGFHISIPYEAFPRRINKNNIKDLFPDAARIIARYLMEFIKKPVGAKILNIMDIGKLVKKTRIKYSDLVVKNEFNPFKIVNIDTILISSRHLFRMPYSMHEKSGLVSVPIDYKKILSFNKSDAKIKNVVVKYPFLERDATRGEAKELFTRAFDYFESEEYTEEEIKKDVYEIKISNLDIKENQFPPCIVNGLKGLEDGRKRFLFVLINFFSSLGWDYSKIEKTIMEWNKRNTEPLRENYIISQLSYFKTKRKIIPPPNCSNQMYYKDIGICKPDNLCKSIKNPISYVIKRAIFLKSNKRRKKSGNKKEDKK